MGGFKLIAKLVVAQAMMQPARMILASLAVIASACAVAWVVSGYEALVSQFDENAAKYLGRYDLIVVTAGGPASAAAALPSSIIDELRRDPAVIEVNPISQSRASVTKVAAEGVESEKMLGILVGSRPPVNGAPPIDPMMVATDANEGPYEMVDGSWLSSDKTTPQQMEAVVSRGAAERLGVAVGDEIDLTTIANRIRTRVVGIIEQAPEAPSGSRGPRSVGRNAVRTGSEPVSKGDDVRSHKSTSAVSKKPVRQGMGIPLAMTQMPAIAAVYVRTTTADLANGYQATPAVLQIALRDGFDIAVFRKAWDVRLASVTPPLRAIDFNSVREGLEQSGSVGQKLSQAYSATALAALAAVFIIFSTLSMGVSERGREFAMLRAIALTRGQIAAIIAVESVLLALIGWGGGLLAGWAILTLAAASKPDLFANGAALGWTCVWLTGASVFGGALGAAMIPAWQAMRIRPIDAMAPPKCTGSPRWPRVSFVVGLALLTVAPISVFLISIDNASRIGIYSLISYPCLLIGMACLTPAVIIACEQRFGPIVARTLKLDPLLALGQLTSNLWRTLGATLALASGLALFVSTQTWGYSMLQPFLPGDWMPDAIVGFQPIGVSNEQMVGIGKVRGIDGEKLLPLAVEQAPIDWPGETPSGMGMENAVVIGLEPNTAFGRVLPRLPLRFVSGNRGDVTRLLANGDGCLISEDYQLKTGLKVGDALRFKPPNAPDSTVEFHVVGVVSLPGWQWFTKFSGVRRHFVRTGGIVFADATRVRKEFKLGDRTEFFWLDFDNAQPAAKIEASLQEIAQLSAGEKFTTAGVGEITAYRPFARLTATETVRQGIMQRANGVIFGMSQLPLVTLVITSLAVANTVIASIRARTWEMAILRSIGTTRGELVRLVLVEAILIAIVNCLVSLIFGLIAGWCGVGMSRYSGFFFGGPPVFVVPWTHLLTGFAATLGLCLLAAAWPAIKIGRAKPLTLLQTGRAAI
ncbi:MAG: ABC transporter permease [Pirellulales bacterium]|nr:ABC transporter permease [Pirellulales bacterium]